jgi:hypothetical protein
MNYCDRHDEYHLGICPFCKSEAITPRTEAARSPESGLLCGDWVGALREKQKALTPEQRIELWDQITHGYCTHCGCEHDPKYPCQCTNDE